MKDFIIVLIYDKVAMQYSSPLIYNNLECAKRHYKQLIENNPSISNTGDYELFILGYFDSFSGILSYKDKSLLPLSLATFEGGVLLDEKE